MQSPRSSAIEPLSSHDQRITGRRAIIEFSPGLTTIERLCAGVVIQTVDGTTTYRSALEARKAEHAFGHAGLSLAAVASTLCKSLADHWVTHPDKPWQPPFEGAGIARQTEFTANNEAAAIDFALQQHSCLHALMSVYEMGSTVRQSSIVRRVRSVVRREARTKHLAVRFEREIDLGEAAGPLRVDFLGQNFACFFVSLTHSERGIDASSERAFGKLFELQAVRRFVLSKPKAIGLLEDERPKKFELLAIGDRQGLAERRALHRIEAIADQREMLVRHLTDVGDAAHHVADMERTAA